MTALTSQLVARAKIEPLTVDHAGRTLVLRSTTARLSRFVRADLEVVEDGKVVGYITPYDDDEFGAVAARLFGQGMPHVFRSLEDALNEILT